MTTEGEGAAVNRPKFDWTINVSTMLAIGAVAAGAGAWLLNLRDTVNTHTSQITSLTTSQAELIVKRDARVLEVDRRLAAGEEVRFRVQAVEEALKSTNARVDASLANVSTGLREINQAIGGLTTSVAVLTQRFDQAQPQRRAEAGPPR